MRSGASMNCGEFAQRAADYVDGTLSPTERERCESHVRECPACRAQLSEMRWLVEAAGRPRLSAAAPADPSRPTVLELFRRHGLHRDQARARDVPLGIGKHQAALGDHIAYLWESERDFAATAGFLATGFERGDACVLLGDDPINRRVLAALSQLGLKASDFERRDLLYLASPATSGDEMLGALEERVKTGVERGLSGVRVLGNLGWGEPGWPEMGELLRLEARVTDAIRRFPSIVICAYDVGRTPARALLRGGFECHPSILHRDALRSNDAFVPAEQFLAQL